MSKCKFCNHRVAPNALMCPNCGGKLQQSAGEQVRLGCAVIAAILLLGFIVFLFIH